MASEAQPLLECEENDKEVSLSNRCRSNACRFLESKWGHYSIIILVAADISGIFADFLLKLYICEHTCRGRQTISASFYQLTDLLGIMSLIFSSLFLLELVVSIWAFGIQYFKSWFHCLDATVILAGFVIDVTLTGVKEEAGSIIVVLRLWRVFKIIEELSAGASEQMDDLKEQAERLREQKSDLVIEINNLRKAQVP